MMFIQRALTIFAFGLGLSVLAGCAADTSDDEQQPTTEDPGESTDDVVTGKKFHYAPANASVLWKPGCGMRSPDGHVCENGLFLKFTRSYIDLKVTKTVKFDSATNTATVTLDTWSTSKTHPMTLVALMPQEERLEIEGPHPMRFHARVVDWKGKQLFAGEINEVFAP